MTMRGKYINFYEDLIHRFEIYTNAVRILLKGYLFTSLLPPNEFQDMLDEIKKLFELQIQIMKFL